MKIKLKLVLGIGCLFALVVFLAILGIAKVHAIAADTKNILVANYNSLDYSRLMLKALDETGTENDALNKFEANLRKQQANITETGEEELTDNLSEHFTLLKGDANNPQFQKQVRADLNDIMKLNMNAIERKSSFANATANNAIFSISVTGTLCFLLAFVLLLNIPGSIANPIKELTESIKQIAAKNYSQRVHFQQHDEFGELAGSFNTMAEKLEEYNSSNMAKLMTEKKRIETLIDNMHDPVIGMDENKKIIFANEEALKVTGLKRENVIDKSSQELSLTNDLIRALLRDVVTSEMQQEPAKPVKIYADNKESYFEKEIVHISILPTGEKEKKLIGYVIILRNITSYKELDFAKTNFIATVSHELKTPLSSIKMSVQILEEEQAGKISEEQKTLLEGIKDDANRLLKITGELLNMTQVESGNIQLSIVPADAKEIVSYAVNATKMQAEQKQVKIEVECSAGLPKVIADSEKTAWVLINLVSNAIRFSYEHSTVLVSVFSKGSSVIFSVKDSGQGIAPQYKDKIFERYFRVPGTQKEGTGLGLAISKEFIEAQGGRITVDTDPGAGSTFTITLNKAV